MSARRRAAKKSDSLTWEQRHQIAQREYLAKLVIYEFAETCLKLVDLAESIRDLWKEFEKLPRGETILGSRTKKEFCEKHLHRNLRTIQYMLAGGNPQNKSRREIISSLPQEPAIPIIEPTAAERAQQQAEDAEERAWRAKHTTAEPRIPPFAEGSVSRFKSGVSAEIRAAALAIVDKGYKAESMLKHPDRGGTHESMIAVNTAVKLLRGYVEWMDA